MTEKRELIESLVWLEGFRWSYKVQFGISSDSYQFCVVWNTRNESFEVTIKTLEGEEILTGRKMVLNVDLLEHCYSSFKPIKCALIPIASKTGLLRITYDSMVSGDIRLFSITQEIKD